MDGNNALHDFIKEHDLVMDSELVADNPNMHGDMPRGSTHWKCTIKHGDGSKMGVFFSMGPAHHREPELEEVLDCLASDAGSVENARSFEEWASDLGYDEDSRKAEKTFRICEKQAEELKTLLGSDAYETLLWNCERL